MSENSIQERVVEILADILKCRPVEQIGGRGTKPTDISREQITFEARLVEDLGMDSLDITDFITRIQEELGADIPDEDVEKISTLGQVVNRVYASIKLVKA